MIKPLPLLLLLLLLQLLLLLLWFLLLLLLLWLLLLLSLPLSLSWYCTRLVVHSELKSDLVYSCCPQDAFKGQRKEGEDIIISCKFLDLLATLADHFQSDILSISACGQPLECF